MDNFINIHYIDGSPQQQAFIKQVHQTAVNMVQRAQQVAKSGGSSFHAWFGSSSTDTVSKRFEEILNYLNTSRFDYVLNPTQMFPYLMQNEVVFCLNDLKQDVSSLQLTVSPWKGLFLQSSEQATAISRQASLSLIHLVASACEKWHDLAISSDRDGAQLIAKWHPEDAVVSPRNYMYYADAVNI
jgi:hypothetical protein